MKTNDQAMGTRKQLIKLVKGEPQYYMITYSVDIKGNITIWDGGPLEHHDLFNQRSTEDHLHLYDGWRRGAELVQLEREAADRITREALVGAFLEFRKQHPRDGYGVFCYNANSWAGGKDNGFQADRTDKEDVERELRRRNREYIFELYGERLPVDFDFVADYNRRLEAGELK